VHADLDASRSAGSGDGRRHLPRHRRRRTRSFGAALGLTVVGALVPGTAFLAAGRKRLGAITLTVFLLLVAGGVYLATAGQRVAVRLAVDSGSLLWLIGGVGVLGLLWVLVIAAGYRMLAPPGARGLQHAVGALLVVLLAVGVALPAYWVVQLAGAQRGLIDSVFAVDRESATVEDVPNPFGTKERVNVLLLGGDSGPGREGLRTDTVIVASIDTDTGDTTLFSLPRNLEDLPFPPGTPLAEAYPDGFDAGTENESLLNAVYRNGPAMYPDILGPTADAGADFLKLGVGEALGLDIDYFVLVNLEGFSRLVDALGGITVNVNYWVPINGDPGTGQLPDDYITPGKDQHLDGELALQFARGRFGLTDYDRMARQRCTIDAIIDAADPTTVLSQYQQIARTTQDIVSTDIPRSALSDFVDLGFLVKDAEVRSVVFDNTLIDPAYPDYALMRQVVQDAIDPPASPAQNSSPAPDGTTPPADTGTAGETPPPSQAPVADVADACAYDSARAEAALAEGEPPTRNR
jgi:polyisoprenyl-teichoic acid--peptidoglycan teichoic acid transferase